MGDLLHTWRTWRCRLHLSHRWRTRQVEAATEYTGERYQTCLDCGKYRDVAMMMPPF